MAPLSQDKSLWAIKKKQKKTTCHTRGHPVCRCALPNEATVAFKSARYHLQAERSLFYTFNVWSLFHEKTVVQDAMRMFSSGTLLSRNSFLPPWNNLSNRSVSKFKPDCDRRIDSDSLVCNFHLGITQSQTLCRTALGRVAQAVITWTAVSLVEGIFNNYNPFCASELESLMRFQRQLNGLEIWVNVLKKASPHLRTEPTTASKNEKIRQATSSDEILPGLCGFLIKIRGKHLPSTYGGCQRTEWLYLKRLEFDILPAPVWKSLQWINALGS